MTYPAHVRCLLPLLFGALFVGAGCGEPPAPARHGGTALGAANAALPDTVETLDYKLQPEVVTSAVEEPWAIAFLSADSALVTEQPGRLRLLVDGTMLPDSIHGTPEVSYLGVQGGLLDVAVDPNYDRNGWIYLTYAHGLSAAEDAQPPTMIRVVRGRIRNGAWQDQQVLFERRGFSLAAASPLTRTVTSTSRLETVAPGRSTRPQSTRKISLGPAGRSTAPTATDPFHRITPSWTTKTRCHPSTRTGTATHRDWQPIQRQAQCGRWSTAPAAGTNLTAS